MIPVDLQECLIKELETLFDEVEYLNISGEFSKLNIYEQELPPFKKKYDEDVDTRFPFIIVELESGGENSETDPNTAKVNFIIGTVNPQIVKITDENNYKWSGSGSSIVFSIINKIDYLLKTKRVFNKQFEIDYPLNWQVKGEDTYPFYYGAIESNWKVTKINQNDKEITSWL